MPEGVSPATATVKVEEALRRQWRLSEKFAESWIFLAGILTIIILLGIIALLLKEGLPVFLHTPPWDFFFGTKWADPQHYDLVIRTAKLSAEQAVQGIVDVTPPRRDGAQQQVLIDRCLEMRVRTLLIYREQLSIMALSVEASEGVVTLRGQMIHEARIDEVSALVSNLEDVRKVDNQLVLNHYPMISDHYF